MMIGDFIFIMEASLLLLFLLLAHAGGQNHTVLVLVRHEWPRFYPCNASIPNSYAELRPYARELHPAALRLTMPIRQMDALFHTNIEPVNGTFRSPTPYTSPYPWVHSVVGLDDVVSPRHAHVIAKGLVAKNPVRGPSGLSPSRTLRVVGWDDESGDFTWSLRDSSRFATSWGIERPPEIYGHSDGRPSILCSAIVQTISMLRPLAEVEIRRYGAAQHTLDALYDAYADPPDFLVFVQGRPACALCEFIIAELRSLGVTIIASAPMIAQNQQTLGYPASSPNVIGVGSITERQHAASFHENGYCSSQAVDYVAPGDVRVVHDFTPSRVSGTAISAISFAAALLDLAHEAGRPTMWKEELEALYASRDCVDCFQDIIKGWCFDQEARYGRDNVTGRGAINVRNIHAAMQNRNESIPFLAFVPDSAFPEREDRSQLLLFGVVMCVWWAFMVVKLRVEAPAFCLFAVFIVLSTYVLFPPK